MNTVLSPLQKPLPAGSLLWQQGLRFGLTGLANTLLTFVLILLAKPLLGITAANVLGYLCGMALSFSLNRRWTFASRRTAWKTLAGFLAVSGLALLLNCSLIASAMALGSTYLPAQILGSVSYTLFSFWAMRTYVFRN